MFVSTDNARKLFFDFPERKQDFVHKTSRPAAIESVLVARGLTVLTEKHLFKLNAYEKEFLIFQVEVGSLARKS